MRELEIKKIKRTPAAVWLTGMMLLATLCVSLTLSESKGRAQSHQRQARRIAKLSRDLDERVQGASSGENRQDVILQLSDKPGSRLNALLKRNGVRLRGQFNNLNSFSVDLPASAVEELSSFTEVSRISLNNRVESFGHISSTTGVDAMRSTKGANNNGLDGSGIGIAILDSGIDTAHKSFLGKNNNMRVVYSRDFTGEGRTDDPYGHGTHVASIAAGNGRVSNAQYVGIAPAASLINLRVLDSQGTGTVAWVLAALDWVMANRMAYNIRVVNMSLGMPAVDSYRNDPVCRAVRRLVDAGLVVVASAGNNGKTSAGQKVYGQIKSPGNEPSAITVGAANTFGTDSRNDDTVTTFSSRGPTRSYWTDDSDVRHYDNQIKPDIVAPGNKLVYAEAYENLLVRQNPQLDAGVSPVPSRKMMYMNGTSMAAPIAAGTAALLLQANPKLTPNLVKMILMYTAQPLANFNMFEQGAGELNIEGAVRLARLVRSDLSATTSVGSPLLTSATAPSPRTTIAGQTFTWSQGIIAGPTFASGLSLITKYQKIYALGAVIADGVVLADGVVMADGVMMADGVVMADRTKMSAGVLVGDQVLTSNGVVLADGKPFLSVRTLLGEGAVIADGVVLADGVLLADGCVMADGVLLADSVMQAQSAKVNGDPSVASSVEVDTGMDYPGN